MDTLSKRLQCSTLDILYNLRKELKARWKALALNSHDRGGVIGVGLGQITRAVVFEGKSIEVSLSTGVRPSGPRFEKAA